MHKGVDRKYNHEFIMNSWFNSNGMFLWQQDISSFQHYKLTLHRTVAHVGEVSWQQYSQSLSRSLVNIV